MPQKFCRRWCPANMDMAMRLLVAGVMIPGRVNVDKKRERDRKHPNVWEIFNDLQN